MCVFPCLRTLFGLLSFLPFLCFFSFPFASLCSSSFLLSFSLFSILSLFLLLFFMFVVTKNAKTAKLPIPTPQRECWAQGKGDLTARWGCTKKCERAKPLSSTISPIVRPQGYAPLALCEEVQKQEPTHIAF